MRRWGFDSNENSWRPNECSLLKLPNVHSCLVLKLWNVHSFHVLKLRNVYSFHGSPPYFLQSVASCCCMVFSWGWNPLMNRVCRLQISMSRHRFWKFPFCFPAPTPHGDDDDLTWSA